jgi:putative ABC transport system permease protein
MSVAALSVFVARAPAELALFDRGWLDVVDLRVLGFTSAIVLTTIALESLLFEITSTDTATYISISLLLLMISVVACVIPARRTAAVDPVLALKQE